MAATTLLSCDSPATLLPSPTASTTHYMVSNGSRSSTTSQSFDLVSDDSDDEIVWSVSVGSTSSSKCEDTKVEIDDDYVVLSRPGSPTPAATGLCTPEEGESLEPNILSARSLESQMNDLSLTVAQRPQKEKTRTMKVKVVQGHSPAPAISKKRKKGKKKQNAQSRPSKGYTCPPTQAYPSPAPSPQTEKSRKFKLLVAPVSSADPEIRVFHDASKEAGLGARPIVDDYSDRQSIISYDESVESPTLYEEASTFISSFLSNPDAKNDQVCRLTLLQSLIIELGLATPSLPDSMTAAKAFLKSRAFLNIREYIAVRGQGPEAVQRAMYPSRSALIKDIRKKKNMASLKWVKQHGLQVLLVGLMH